MRSRAPRWFVAAFVAALAVSGAAVAPAHAQVAADAPVAPCHATACALTFDWGSGRTAASFGPDRRYGSGDDFEARFRGAMGESGLRTKDAPAYGPLAITVRPTMKAKAMCDQMPGTNTDLSCSAMSDLTVSFVSTDAAVKAPGSMRVSNRCGSGDTYMIMTVFAKYAVDMVYYTLEGQQKKEPRPRSQC